MRMIYALAFICASFQASATDWGTSACDLEALNAAAAIESYDYVGTLPQASIPDYDEAIDPIIYYGSLENAFGADSTGSLPSVNEDERFEEATDDQFFAY